MEYSIIQLAGQVKKGKIPIKNRTRILEGAMCTEDFPAECKNENAGCALTLPNTIKIVFLQQCQHMHGREGGIIRNDSAG